MKTFAPTINFNGETVIPKGYMWVLGFALAGCEWAVKEASKPEFLNMVRASLMKEEITMFENNIEYYERKISECKLEIEQHVGEIG